MFFHIEVELCASIRPVLILLWKAILLSAPILSVLSQLMPVFIDGKCSLIPWYSL